MDFGPAGGDRAGFTGIRYVGDPLTGRARRPCAPADRGDASSRLQELALAQRRAQAAPLPRFRGVELRECLEGFALAFPAQPK